MPRRLPRRLTQLVLGLVLYGAGLALMVRGAIGVPPWDVLSQGLVNHFGLSFGLWTNIIGAVVLLAWIPLRQMPGVGTVLNVIMVGPSAQVVLWLLPEQESLWVRIPLFVLGLLAVAVASGLYIGANLGPGPRDGLMTGLHRRTGARIWVVRTAIEIVVLAIGWILGGNVGIGTLAFALLIGPMIGVTLDWFTVRPRAPQAEEVNA